ncbi:MAG: copper homeostasis protein CutC [Clostridiaceae bacterium]|nr:copper homeostasis protein CutC [Clostridiaceae bacterium]
MSKDILLEVCCGSVDDTIEAQAGGADRVELNSSIFFGGLTPSLGSLIEAKKRLKIPVMVMIRPRGGGFCYTDTEFEIMKHDTRLAVENGADGIVFGILKSDGTVDEKRCEEIVKLSKDKDTVFHRAIDVAPDPFKALDSLINLGIKRVLTTGQQNTPEEGLDLIIDLMKYAAGRIEILIGSVTPFNVDYIVEKTRCTQVHMASFRTERDTSTLARPHIYYGFALYPPEDRYELANRNVISIVNNKLKK